MVPPPCTTEGRAIIISFDMAAGCLNQGSDHPFCTMHLDYGLEPLDFLLLLLPIGHSASLL